MPEAREQRLKLRQRVTRKEYIFLITVLAVLIGYYVLHTQEGWFHIFEDRGDLAITPGNPSLLEARRWTEGHLSLKDDIRKYPDERPHDTAFYKGSAYNVFQPGQTIYFLSHWLLWPEQWGVPLFKLEMIAIAVITIFLFFCALFEWTGGKGVPVALILISAFLGAPYLPSFTRALGGSVYRVNHVFAWLFIAMALYFLSRRLTLKRLFLCGASIGVGMLFRGQTLLLLLLPALLLLQNEDGKKWQLRERLLDPKERNFFLKQLAALGAIPALSMLAIMTMNYLRFDHPFETGYSLIYVERDGYFGQRAKEIGLFSPYFMLENFFRHFWSTPNMEFEGWRIPQIGGDHRGNGLFFTTPILLGLFVMIVRTIDFPRVQAVLMTALLMALPALMYHNPGIHAPGYARYALDYVPLLFLSLAVMFAYDPQWKRVCVLAIPATFWALYYAVILR